MKVQIHNLVLQGQSQDWVLQRVASAYDNGVEYHVYAPARAKGDASGWIGQFVVRQLSDSLKGENDVDARTATLIIEEVAGQLEKNKLRSNIWTWENDSGSFYEGYICRKGHVQSSDGKNPPTGDEHCQKCGSVVIKNCLHCDAPIRGQEVYTQEYVCPSFCYKCGRPYPWQEERLQIARELLYHDNKLNQDDREKLWDLLKDVMSNPTDGLVPAKRKLIDFNLAKAGTATKDILTDLVAKTIAEIVKP